MVNPRRDYLTSDSLNPQVERIIDARACGPFELKPQTLLSSPVPEDDWQISLEKGRGSGGGGGYSTYLPIRAALLKCVPFHCCCSSVRAMPLLLISAAAVVLLAMKLVINRGRLPACITTLLERRVPRVYGGLWSRNITTPCNVEQFK